ncbi:helix-turn-helix domain-containing protein [Streptomyces filamentosus]|uniref:AraC-like ligand-binding domain-containing protein n=1 Tax=Streptomyces filamentosus TaxID=67294 RepID=UPI00123C29F3|nr:helix-turn-helix domain-containing protein [Streptomyces filamentosus]KAA6215738.1 helix-turn-helix domain-containing protein [Streptomyces filamentosus]
MPIVLSTEPLTAADRAERWHEVVSGTFMPMDVNLLESKPSPGKIVSSRLGTLHISRVQAGPQVVKRTKRHISRDDRPSLIVSLQQRGTATKEQDGRETVIGPGEFSISDSSRLFRIGLDEEFAFTSFHFPREELHVRDEDLQALTATTFTGEEGSAALVATYLARVAREAEGFDEGVGRRVAATALDLMVMLIDERRGRAASEGAHVASASLERVKEHILRNLGDPGLSPSTIAEAHFMSVRYLHRLFQLEDLTVGGWIRTQRLERCRRELLRPRAAQAGVAAIAQRWGFVSPSHFSRVFRAAYGTTPREWQLQGRSGAHRGDVDGTPTEE